MSEQNTYTLDEIENQTGFDKRTIAYYVQQGLLPKVGRRGPKTRYPQLFLDRLQFVNLIREKQDLGEIGSLTLAEIGGIFDRISPETVAGVVAGAEPLSVVNHIVELKSLSGSGSEDDSERASFEISEETPALAQEAAEIEEEFVIAIETGETPGPDVNRRVRLGLMDANSVLPYRSLQEVETGERQGGATVAKFEGPAAGNTGPHSPRRYEDEVRRRQDEQSIDEAPDTEETESDDTEVAPPSIEIERLGWFLARLQRAMTGSGRRRTGTTESWQRAMITPELTMSARNLRDEDAYMLDAVARILKKMLWKAWEE